MCIGLSAQLGNKQVMHDVSMPHYLFANRTCVACIESMLVLRLGVLPAYDFYQNDKPVKFSKNVSPMSTLHGGGLVCLPTSHQHGPIQGCSGTAACLPASLASQQPCVVLHKANLILKISLLKHGRVCYIRTITSPPVLPNQPEAKILKFFFGCL